MRLLLVKNDAGEIQGYSFYCPGCDFRHVFWMTWEFNGNFENPTFNPSLLNEAPNHPDPKQRRCHLNITNGDLIFHPDCSHDFAGRTIKLAFVEKRV
jgi:Family of unknown function (DUF6527)